jgi:ABC-2 type transport system permease protein
VSEILTSPPVLLTGRTIRQIPRNPVVLVFSLAPVVLFFLVFGELFENLTDLPGFPTDSYYEYLAPAMVLMSGMIGIANAATGLATDFQSGYLYKLVTSEAPIGSILLGRLIGDTVRLFVQGAGVLLLALVLGARVDTGLGGALVMLALASAFSLVTLGLLTANVAMRMKDPAAIQSILPIAFVLTFLTTAFQTEAQIPSALMRRLIDLNPTELVLRPMRHLMLDGYDWPAIGGAVLAVAVIASVAIPLTIANYRAIYR